VSGYLNMSVYSKILRELYFQPSINFLSVKFVSFRNFVFRMLFQCLIIIYIFRVSAPCAHDLYEGS
jgi:hypothetical protein